MPNKIKIALTLVAIVAGFLVYQLAQYVHTIANGNSTFQQGTPLPNPDDDPDHDGLNNQQEIIWGTDPFNSDSDKDGFKDGEEIKSGHNPLVPGPNDLLNDDNLTQKISDLTVSGLYSGDLKPESQNYQRAIADIADAIADSSKYTFAQKTISTDLNIIEGGTKNNKEYLKKLNPILTDFEISLKDQYENLIPNLNIVGERGFSDQSIKDFYSKQESKQLDLFKQMSDLDIPRDFKDAHQHFMSIIQRVGDISESIKNGEVDPVKASSALSNLAEMYQNYETMLSEYSVVINSRSLGESL